ncbi:MAG: hypothetical protein ACK5XA_08625 [Tagaea sp.]
MSDDLRAAAEKVRDWLRDERMGSWRYMENGDFYSDLTGMAKLLDAALAAEQPSVPRPGKYLRWWPIRSAAAEQPQPVASGWKLVPVEPTLEMLSAPLPESPIGSRYESRRDLRSTIYLAMLAAAPPPPDAAEQPVAWAVAFNGRADIDYAYYLRDGAESAAEYLRAHKAELGPFTVVPLFAGPPPAAPAEQPQPVAEVTDSMMGLKRIRWLSDEAVGRSPIGAKLYLAPPPPAPAEQPQHHYACSTTRGGECDCYYVLGAGVNLGGRSPVFVSVMGAADPEKTPPPAATCPHIRSNGDGEWATNWCALNGQPAAAPITDAMVDAALEAGDAYCYAHTNGRVDRKAHMRAALAAAAKARNTNPA